MYKETIPVDSIVRKTQSHLSSEQPNKATQDLSSTASGSAQIQSELAEWNERYLRLAADFDNFKKRTARENERRAAEQKSALVQELLPVVDNLERALGDGTAQTTVQLREGVELTLRQLIRALNQHGFASRDDRGQPFDPHFHEAVGVRSEPKHADHTILEVWQRAWIRGKELFRPAKVVVNDLKSGHQENAQH